MRIINRTDRLISYELKGGPLRMTLSKCDLEPGEEEVWESPYRVQRLDVDCELHVIVDDMPYMMKAGDTDTVAVEQDDDGGIALRRV